MNPIETVTYDDTQRMQLRSEILIASKMVSTYWPMRTFVHHNPLHGLEDLHFEEAVRRAQRALEGEGYLSNELFRTYFRTGRILPEYLDAALKPHAGEEKVTLGQKEIHHLDVLRIHFLQGISAPVPPSEKTALEAWIARSPNREQITFLAKYLAPVLKLPDIKERIDARLLKEKNALGRTSTLANWCDHILGTTITDQINRELVKWCEGFLDEGHATWSMPGREKGFFGVWKWLAGQEWSPCGIPDTPRKLASLPDLPEDALLEQLHALGIPSEGWQDYIMHHLAALPGWTGFIRWRADQTDYEWQLVYPIDLIQYLAVRFWYERELVQKVCQTELGIEGNQNSMSEILLGKISDDLKKQEPSNGGSLGYYVQSAALRLVALAEALEIPSDDLIRTPPETLKIVLDWIEAFPESEHGPVWLKAFETDYQERLLEKLRPQIYGKGKEATPDRREGARPQAQAIFCIDVRSETFRRHFETVGDNETFGFAGFFNVFIRYRALGSHHDTDQYPVIMHAKNEVHEYPRTYHSQLLSKHRAGTELLHNLHELLHNLKENVVTPYVMVESLGWFYSLPIIGKTVFTSWYQSFIGWLRSTFVPFVSTTLTVDKLSRQEVETMVSADQRAVIRRALREKFGESDPNLPVERLETLRHQALDTSELDPSFSPESSPSMGSKPFSSAEDEAAFVEDLRKRYRIDPHWTFAHMERVTRRGFSLTEQIFTVETALRMMGLTRNFSRLVLFCGHGSTSDNNPFEAALDCGACGGNVGKPNSRILAAMANKHQVREALSKNGLNIPPDTFFIAGQHDTTTDEVQLFDLEDLPPTHLRDLLHLNHDLEEAGLRTRVERCSRFPEVPLPISPSRAARETSRRSGDWSEVRPEWGLSGNAAFIIGRRELTQGIPLDGRVFLHSYDYREDPTGELLEIVMTGPQVVGQWINMEHYFSTTDTEVYGSGSKIYHNVVGRFGIMAGPQSDLRVGLATQTVKDGPRPFHEPMRLLTLIEAPKERINRIIRSHKILQHFYENEWVYLKVLEPEEKIFYGYVPKQGWTLIP